jgi:hypothetical protein
MSLKDVRVIAIILVLLAFILTPVFKKMEYDGKVKMCKGNIEHVAKAVLLYADQNDQRFPPAFAEDGPGIPKLERGYPTTWVTVVDRYMSDKGDFGCPIADTTELCSNAASVQDGPTLRSAFGLTVGMATQPADLLTAPSTTVFLTESSNRGAKGTYDPVTFQTIQGGPLKDDGFLVGYDNPGGNSEPDTTTKFMTRLAFYDSNDYNFNSEKVRPRHEGGLFMIFADGHLGKLDQAEAQVTLLHDEPQGYWRSK